MSKDEINLKPNRPSRV